MVFGAVRSVRHIPLNAGGAYMRLVGLFEFHVLEQYLRADGKGLVVKLFNHRRLFPKQGGIVIEKLDSGKSSDLQGGVDAGFEQGERRALAEFRHDFFQPLISPKNIQNFLFLVFQFLPVEPGDNISIAEVGMNELDIFVACNKRREVFELSLRKWIVLYHFFLF